MDLTLWWGVVRRYRRISIAGAVLAVVLAVLAYGTPSLSHGSPTIVPHGASTYRSAAELLLTQGLGTYSTVDPKTVAAGAPGYLSSLSPIYAGLANGSAVQAAVRAARVPGTVTATEGLDPLTGDYTPFIDMTANAPTPGDAAILIKRGISSLQRYVNAMEANSGVPSSERIQLEVIKSGLPPVLASRPKLTIPILVFIAVLVATLALIFSLENHDPQTAARLGRINGEGAHGEGAHGEGALAGGALGEGRHSGAEAHRNGAERRMIAESLARPD